MPGTEHNVSVTMAQVLSWVEQCTIQEKRVLLRALIDDTAALTVASEPSLAKDWQDPEEDEAWKDL